jgi:hypothetical protein
VTLGRTSLAMNCAFQKLTYLPTSMVACALIKD